MMENFISAKEAFEITEKKQKEIMSNRILELENCIQSASKKGEYFIEYKKTLSEDVIRKLFELGYEISRYFDSKYISAENNESYVISWTMEAETLIMNRGGNK